MKIQRVTTLAFSISPEKEEKLENDLKKKKKKRFLGIIGKEEEPEIIKGYSPLAKFKLTRLEKVSKGLLKEKEFESLDSYFFIDLNNLELFYFDGENFEIKRYEIIQKIFNLSENSVKTLGNLLRHGETLLEKINPDVVMELISVGLIKIFKPKLKEVSALLIDELSPESPHKTLVKERVKISFHIPLFGNRGYNLSNFIDSEDTWVEIYSRKSIKFSVDKLSKILKDLFQAEVILDGVFFMPFFECRFIDEKKSRILERYFPVCFLGRDKLKRKGVKLIPISLSTEIGVSGGVPIERPTINFSDVANLENIKEEIRNEIIYPLIKPELAKEFGRKAGGGILLYGPPGCGKTYIAKATVGECGVSFFNVNLSDLFSRGRDIAPKNLHDIFEQVAKETPAIIFFDEIDAIGGKKTAEEEHAARMLINQLLVEIDGVESLKEKVLFIASTNAPWAIDPALRRTERFTKQIFVPPPDLKTREELFKIYTKDKPLDEGDIDFKKLAELTENYASSDIKTVCDLASEIPWEEALHGGEERKIQMSDFLQAIKKQKSSLIPWFKLAREEMEKSGELKLYEEFSKYLLKYAGGIEEAKKPEITFKDVGNLQKAKEEISKRVILPILNIELTKKFDREFGEAILLYGPPGCGKTYLVKAVVNECKASFFNVKITDILLKERGAPEKKIQEIFERAEKNSPSIIFFDEIDSLIGRRDLTQEKLMCTIIGQFLLEMDSFEQRRGVFVIGATNAPWAIDPALRRAGRFTTQIFISSPDSESRAEIFKIHLKDKRVSNDVDIEELASLTELYGSSDIKTVCDLASEIPWEEALHGGEERKIQMSDFLQAIKKQKSSLIPWFKMAKKQLLESGEKDIYKELLESITEFEEKIKKIEREEKKLKLEEILEEEKLGIGMITKEKKRKLEELENEKRRVEGMISIAKHRYYNRKIDEESFRRIIKDYEKKLIELNVAIKELSPE